MAILMGALLLGGASAGQGLLQGIANRKNAKYQNAQIKRQNTINLAQASYAAADMQREGALARMQLTKTKELQQRAAQAELSSTAATAGAAGVKGASVDAVAQDVQRELSEAEYETTVQYKQHQEDLQRRIHDIRQQALLGQAPKVHVPSYSQVLASSVMQGSFAIGGAYANQYFQLASQR